MVRRSDRVLFPETHKDKGLHSVCLTTPTRGFETIQRGEARKDGVGGMTRRKRARERALFHDDHHSPILSSFFISLLSDPLLLFSLLPLTSAHQQHTRWTTPHSTKQTRYPKVLFTNRCITYPLKDHHKPPDPQLSDILSHRECLYFLPTSRKGDKMCDG